MLDGDPAAYADFASRYLPPLYRYTRARLGGERERTSDIVQTAITKALGKLDSYRGEAALLTWLCSCCRNEVLMHFRKRSVKSELTTDDGEMPDSVDPDTLNPEAMPIVDRISLETAIAQLPPGYRTAFVLHDVEGYEHEEIAKILGCSPGTSKSQLHKARLKLRKLIQQRVPGAQEAA